MQTPGMDARYDEDYFIRGKESGKSLYDNYRWMPNLTIPMCDTIAEHCGIELEDRILDFGCARGYSVKAFRHLQFEAFGVDVSEWALANADPEVREFCKPTWPEQPIDWVIAKDVLEHVPEAILSKTINQFFERARRGVFVVVPLAFPDKKGYVVPEYEADVTHCIRLPLWGWLAIFTDQMPANWEVSACYRVKGVKDNYAQFEKGNGFITCRRVS